MSPSQANKFTRGLGLAALVAALALLLPASGAEALSLESQSFRMSGADSKARLMVKCPKKRVALGGGMQTDSLDADGEGIYPHSYERLGIQRGFHVTPVLFDPSPSRTATRTLTLQVLCGPRLGPVSAKRWTEFVRPGESRTAIAGCPRGTRLVAGGFQRTNFISGAGNYVTESRAASPRSWRVSASAFGRFGGELTAIAYCLRSKRALVSEISGGSPLAVGRSALATTPPCSPGSRLVSGGFSTSPSGPALISSAYFNPDGTWSSLAFNNFGPAATLSAHGYCMETKKIKSLERRRHGPRAPHEVKNVKAPKILDAALKVAIAERVSRNGCYPPPAELVRKLRASGIRARAATRLRAVRPGRVAYVLSRASSCSQLRLAMRRGGRVFVLDSASGEVRRLSG